MAVENPPMRRGGQSNILCSTANMLAGVCSPGGTRHHTHHWLSIKRIFWPVSPDGPFLDLQELSAKNFVVKTALWPSPLHAHRSIHRRLRRSYDENEHLIHRNVVRFRNLSRWTRAEDYPPVCTGSESYSFISHEIAAKALYNCKALQMMLVGYISFKICTESKSFRKQKG